MTKIAAALIAVAGLALGGCETATSIAQEAVTDDQQCQSYGFKPMTDPYAMCRLQLNQNRLVANARKREAIGEGLDSVSQGFYRAAADTPKPAPTIRCQSERQVDGSVQTVCQ